MTQTWYYILIMNISKTSANFILRPSCTFKLIFNNELTLISTKSHTQKQPKALLFQMFSLNFDFVIILHFNYFFFKIP